MLYGYMRHSEEAFHHVEEKRLGTYSGSAVSGSPVGPGSQAGSSVTLVGYGSALPSGGFLGWIESQNGTEHRLAICAGGPGASALRQASARCIPIADQHSETANHCHGLLGSSGGAGALDDSVNRRGVDSAQGGTDGRPGNHSNPTAAPREQTVADQELVCGRTHAGIHPQNGGRLSRLRTALECETAGGLRGRKAVAGAGRCAGASS